jgi:hypothetical protein
MVKNNTMKYKILENDKFVGVNKETWCWEAVYIDGSTLYQFDDNGTFHRFEEIDQSKLSRFSMVKVGEPAYILMFNSENMKLIHFYKRFVLNAGTGEETRFTVYCFGYETKTKGLTNKFITMIMPNGETINTPNTNLIKFT